MNILRKYSFLAFSFFIALNSYGQLRDTLKLTIKKLEKEPPDTVIIFSTRIDTIALQPIKTDTSKIVKDVNPQDLDETRYQIKFLGSIRINSYYDFDGMTSTEGFLPYDIPVGVEKIERLSSTYIGARQSRFGMEGNANTRVGTIKTYLEVDFVSSTSSFWRLRQAYVQWNYFRIGYTWSTFMDNSSLPGTVDFEGPNSALTKRNGLIRYEKILSQSSIAGFSIEAPYTDYYNPADTLIEDKNIQGNFDLVARYKYFGNWGHVQFAGILRRISYLHETTMDKLYGWGGLVSTIININENNTFYSQYSIGNGIANYIVGFNNRELDAVYNPDSRDMVLKMIHGGYVNLNHKFNNKMTLSFTGGVSFMKNYEFEPDDSFSSSQYLAVTYFYNPIETISLGLEVTTGTRINEDNQIGNATRISMIGMFSF
ncbi:MAG: DcaP family trimeric outer membrane transporter [Bacteroidales bacterium]